MLVNDYGQSSVDLSLRSISALICRVGSRRTISLSLAIWFYLGTVKATWSHMPLIVTNFLYRFKEIKFLYCLDGDVQLETKSTGWIAVFQFLRIDLSFVQNVVMINIFNHADEIDLALHSCVL